MNSYVGKTSWLGTATQLGWVVTLVFLLAGFARCEPAVVDPRKQRHRCWWSLGDLICEGL